MAARNGTGRRESLKDPQVQELKNLVPEHVFRGSFGEYNMSNMTRLSGNSIRGSLTTLRKGTGIPQSVTKNKSVLSKSIAPGSSATRSIGRSAIPRNTTGLKGSLQKSKFAASTSSLNLNATRRRSRSHDTLTLLTPAFTPSSRSRSKSPGMSTGRRKGVHNETSDGIGRSISIVKDKKVLGEMAREVYGFLEKLDCQARPGDWRELVNPQKISVAKYMHMVKFLASHFVSESYFSKVDSKVDDDSEKIIELMRLLKYPGTLSKSHLKTPTTQHAWPGCFAFLTWLCCRTNALLNPPAPSSNIEQLNNAGREECAFESYLNLFPLHFRNELTAEHIENELEHFKARVRELEAVEVTKTKEELIQEKAELQAELENLNNEADPAKDVKARLHAEQEVHASLNEKIREVETLCKKYSNIRHLTLQQERIELEINIKKTELQRLKKQIESQPLGKQEASAMRSEISGLKNQLDTIRHVNSNLKAECETRLQKHAACQKEFYELCKSFGIVEKYNENLRFLRLDDYTIPPNPFAPKELEEWMKNVAKTLRRCQTRVNEMVKEMTWSSEQKEKESKEFIKQMNSLKQQQNDWNAKIQGVQKYKEFMEREYEVKRSELQEQLDELHSQLRNEEEVLNEAIKQKDAVEKELNVWRKNLEASQKRANQFDERLKEETGKYFQHCEDLKKTLQDAILRESTAQRSFYLENFNVDIFAGCQELISNFSSKYNNGLHNNINNNNDE